MSNKTEPDLKPEEASSKDEPKIAVETTDYGLKVRITKFSDGSQMCDVRDVTIEESLKDKTPKIPVASLQTAASLAAAPATPSSAAPRELLDGKDAECSTCRALEAALREKIESKAVAPTASRRMNSSLGRRLGKV